SSGLSPALATERISLHDSTFQGRLVMVDVLTGHGDTIVIQQAKCVKIWGREGRLGHVEVFLQMCSFVTSIIERPRLFLCLQHARIRKLIYTQNSEEPLKPSEVTPLTTLRLVELTESLLPPGVLNVVLGDGAGVGSAISHHPNIDMVALTGSV